MATKQRNMLADKSKKIIECQKRGYSIADTCQIVGISRQTLYRWLDEAEQDGASDEHVQFFCDFHDARGQGLEKLIKDLDRWENETETTVAETVEFLKDAEGNIIIGADGEPVGHVVERKETKKKKRSRPSHFERARFKLQSQYPDRWGAKATVDDETDDDTPPPHPLGHIVGKKGTDE